ncbi:hypothetical protein F444_10718 [Phytophthora nicotianae P1976]|uniref:Uncharacterized protein n=1 Tax=Phytophthora nicotianae P1976 TaxID=1317066 RepID=A0A081A371_PHYNI|nr:hypothetical protein F444_10718 [Phytophthora nicotianae P1976]
MEPGDDPDAYEVFDSCDDSDADAFDKHQEVDDVQLVVVDGRETESDSKDDPIDSNGASEMRFKKGFFVHLDEAPRWNPARSTVTHFAS